MSKQDFSKVVQAWADGAEIQFRCIGISWTAMELPFFQEGIEYRVKPQTVRWRAALIQPHGYAKPYPTLVENDEWGKKIEKSSIFVSWMNDWQEVEV